MNKSIFIFLVCVCFYTNSSVISKNKIHIYQDGIKQEYYAGNHSLYVNISQKKSLKFDILNNAGLLVDKNFINFDDRPAILFNNYSSSSLESYLTLFIQHEKLRIDCVYSNYFDNQNGFHQKRAKCGLNKVFFDNLDMLDSVVYDKILLESNDFSVLNENLPFKILVGELGDFSIHRLYSSLEDYEDDKYSIIIDNLSNTFFSISEKIYLRYDLSDQVIGFDIEHVNEDYINLEYFSYNTLNKLFNENIHPQNMKVIVNKNKSIIYIQPFQKTKSYLVYGDQVVLIDEFKDNNSEIWHKIKFDSPKLGTIIAWIKSDDVKFMAKD